MAGFLHRICHCCIMELFLYLLGGKKNRERERNNLKTLIKDHSATHQTLFLSGDRDLGHLKSDAASFSSREVRLP